MRGVISAHRSAATPGSSGVWNISKVTHFRASTFSEPLSVLDKVPFGADGELCSGQRIGNFGPKIVGAPRPVCRLDHLEWAFGMHMHLPSLGLVPLHMVRRKDGVDATEAAPKNHVGLIKCIEAAGQFMQAGISGKHAWWW